MNVVSTESVPLIIMVHVLTTSMVQYDSNINLIAPKSIAMYMAIDYKIQSVECIHKVCKYIMTDKIRRDGKIEKVPHFSVTSLGTNNTQLSARYKGSLQELLILGVQWHAMGDILGFLLMQQSFYNCHITCGSTIIIVWTVSQSINN